MGKRGTSRVRDIEGPHPLDVSLGARVRLKRKERGMSQGQLASAVGITFQQVQKYERGTNRISFSRLSEISDALKCSIADLIEGLGRTKFARVELNQSTHLLVPGAMELLAAYAKISPKQRKTLLKLARQIS